MKVADSNNVKSMTVGASKVVIQDINLNNTKAVISILRDKIYTDKPKAALMETVCNAIDEHKKYNVQRPVDIIITSNNVIVRDYAKGLDEHGVMRVFFQYMNSTKSDNDTDIGGYGIGAKAPSSYTNTWYVTSYHGSKKTTYMSVLDGDVGKTYKMLEQPCPADDTGICVSIPIVGKESTSYYITSDRDKFTYLAGDIRSMLGGLLDKDNVNCYLFDKDSPVKDYNDFIACNEEAKEEALNLFNRVCDRKSLRDLITEAKEENIQNYISVYIPGEILVYKDARSSYGYRRSSIFKSDFFEGKNILAYDGDICYNVNLDREIIRSFDLNDHSTHVIFLFKRGELPIAPTREDINMSSKVNDILKNKLIKLQNHLTLKIGNKFDEEYNKKHSIFYSVNKARSYNRLGVAIDHKGLYKHKFMNNFRNEYNYIASNNTGFIEVTDVLGSVNIKAIKNSRYYNGRAFNEIPDIFYVVTESEANIKHKAFYRKEIINAIIKYREQNGMPNTTEMRVVFVNSENDIKAFFSDGNVLGSESNLIRKNVDWYNIDVLAPLVPKREVSRVYTDTKATKKEKKDTFERVLCSVFSDNTVYKEADIVNKKFMMIPAVSLQTSTNPWKGIVNNINSGNPAFNSTVFKWLFGVDGVVKVYKSDIPFWKKKGIKLAPETQDDIEKLLCKSAVDRKLCVIPNIIYKLDFIEGAKDAIAKKKGNMINIQYGYHDKVINHIGISSYDICKIIGYVSNTWLNNLCNNKAKAVAEAIQNLPDKDREVLINAMTAYSLVYTSNRIIGYIEDSTDAGKKLKQDAYDNSTRYIRNILDVESKKAKGVFAKLIKNIDIQCK